MTYRTDIRLTDSLGTTLTGRGDLETVTEYRDAVVQRATLRAMNAVFEDRGRPNTPQNVEDVRDKAERALRADDVVNQPVDVSADVNGDTLRLDTEIGGDLTVRLTLP
jgi:hypothetical protein